MAIRRRVFRIEEQAERSGLIRTEASIQPSGALPSTGATAPAQHKATLGNLARELEALESDARASVERILSATENLERITSQLSGAERQMLAADMRDCLARIFAACNLHDLAGQRITRALGMLHTVEEHIVLPPAEAVKSQHAPAARAGAGFLLPPVPPADTAAAAPLPALHGPARDGDPGHMTQSEIDALFAV